jgi:N-acetylglucosaminyl-diphospho-decaprenol L-rhamnosyltransferase
VSVSVLIVNYRGYGDLLRCLDSLTPHLRADDEVIVVDHESDSEQLHAVTRRHPGIICIPRRDNLGFAAGVNLASRRARSPFLLLVNPDTTLEGPLLGVMENWLLTHPDTYVVGPRVLNADGSTQASARGVPGFSTLLGGRSTWLTQRHPGNRWSRRNLPGREARGSLDVDWLAGSCFMTPREVFERLGGLDETFFLYWEDADYCRRVAAAGGRRTYLPSVAIRHPGGGSARYNLPRAIRAFHVSAFRLYWKHSGVPGRAIAPLVRVGLHVRGELRLRQALRQRRAGLATTTPPMAAGERDSLLSLADAKPSGPQS